MKKITIYALHLGTGGTEKCVAMLSNFLANYDEEFKIRIVSTYKLAEKSFFEINEKVEIKYLLNKLKPNREEWKDALKKKNLFKFIKESIWAFLTLFLGYTKLIYNMIVDKSDIIISTRTNFNQYLGLFGRKKSVKIGWEHNHYNGDMKKAEKCIKSVKKLDYYVLNSNDLYEFYSKRCKCKCVKISNAIDDYPIEYSSLNNRQLVSVGRLSPEKGYLDLIEVYKLLNTKINNWNLSIVGDGVDMCKIVSSIDKYNLNKKVKLHGFLKKHDINNLLLNSSIYLMTSYTESFGIVLIEAMSYGLPCVAFDSAEGAREIIEDGVNGYLISGRNTDLFVDKVIELINNEDKRKEMGINARKTAKAFTIDNIGKIWLDLFRGAKSDEKRA